MQELLSEYIMLVFEIITTDYYAITLGSVVIFGLLGLTYKLIKG